MAEEAKSASWDWRLIASPATLWPHIADTDRISEDLGAPHYTLKGPGKRPLSFRAEAEEGGEPVSWEERPYEWVAEQWWRQQRWHDDGPIKSAQTTLFLKQNPEGGAVAHFAIDAAPRGWLGKALLGSGYMRHFGKQTHLRLRAIDERIASRALAKTNKKPAALNEAMLGALQQDPYAQGRGRALLEWIAAAPESELRDLRPRRLARILGCSESAAIALCLAAVRAGALELRHSVRCPHCRAERTAAAILSDLHAIKPCDLCGGDEPLDLGANVEILFRPAPVVRAVDGRARSHGGPMASPHTVIQQIMEPAERRELSFVARPGAYRFRASGGGATQYDHPGGGFPILRLTEDGVDLGPVADDGVIVMENRTNRDALLALERRAWRRDALTGAELLMTQSYRELAGAASPPGGGAIRAGYGAVLALKYRAFESYAAAIGEEPDARGSQKAAGALREIARLRDGAITNIDREGATLVFAETAAARAAVADIPAAVSIAFQQVATAGPDVAIGVHFGPLILAARRTGPDYIGNTPDIAARVADYAVSGGGAFTDPGLSESESAAIAAEIGMEPGAAPIGPNGEVARIWLTPPLW